MKSATRSNAAIGRAYAFINCRQPKSEVAYIANDIKGFFAESVPLPLLDKMELRVNQGISSLRKSRIVEAKTGLLRVVMEANGAGVLFLKPGQATVDSGDAVFSHNFGNLYTLRAALPGVPNNGVADELAAIVNQMYNSPLYEDGEPFRGIIAYCENGKYVLRQ